MARGKRDTVTLGVTIAGLAILAAQPAEATTDSVQKNPPWGLDRIDQRTLPLDKQYDDRDQDGAGVTVYVLDSGIRATHTSFGGRVGQGYNGVDASTDTSDCVGHGTAVASVVGADTYGVARAVTLVPIRLNTCDDGVPGNPSTAALEAGINWMIEDHTTRGGPAVANISSVYDDDVDQAVQTAIDAGITVIAGAGNDNTDACAASPARLPDAITVGGTDHNDYRWMDNPTSGSNYGECVDIFAPAKAIAMASNDSDDTEITASGTSMAAPFVAGAAAAYLGTHPTATPADVTQALIGNATKDAIDTVASGGTMGSPNLLLHTGPTNCPTQPQDPEPGLGPPQP